MSCPQSGITLQRDEGIVKVVLIAGLVAFPERLPPFRTAPTRKERVALRDSCVHQRKMDSGSKGKRLPVDLRPADHHQRGIEARRESRLVEGSDDGAIGGLEPRRPGQNEIGPSGQRLADRFVSPAAHEDVLAERQCLEAPQVLTQMPWQPAAAADDIVLRHRDDQFYGGSS